MPPASSHCSSAKPSGEPFEPFKSSLFNDRAVVGGWQRGDEPIQPYTLAETMNSGWCWQIDHEFRINRGYVYSSAFITDAEAEREFRSKNPKVADTRIVKFVSGKYWRSWVKNVVGIGNSMGFVEPLESTGLAMIALESQSLAESLADCQRLPNESMRNQFNKMTGLQWNAIRQFLALHFRFNTRLDTPYWLECCEKADIRQAAEFVDYFKENGPSILWHSALLSTGDQFGPEGYLSLLVGMQVPYNTAYKPTTRDLENWNQIRKIVQKSSEDSLSVNQALAVIRSPQWQWPKIYG